MNFINPKVEVYSTNVTCPQTATRIIEAILLKLPEYEANFDLEDRDNILRVQSDEIICHDKITEVLETFGHACEILPDEISY